LKTQLETLETQSQAKQRAADDEIARLRAELMRTRNELARVNTDLIKVRTDFAQYKASLEQQTPQTSSSPTAQAAPEGVKSPGQGPTTASAAPSSATASVSSPAVPGTREYVIKEGDSFWKIAASQLGSGTRYKEILQLNPTLSPNKPLEIGTKILIPAK
jgi:nucleoid-associated protein YgaU